ncbi:MAG: glutathione peroxidase [Ferruginibacter sp.]
MIRNAAIVLLIISICFIAYVAVVNRNSKDMTPRQKILKAVYPAMMWITKLTGTNNASSYKKDIMPIVPLYNLSAISNSGKRLAFNEFKGKKILLVNTASDCGYTGQYASLEKLYRDHGDRLVVLGFPANDFKEQEKGTDETIASFCKVNYGVTFPLMQKSSVIKGSSQNEIFAWLSDKNKNGWNNEAPTWNFCKYLVDEKGDLTHFFASSVEPLSKEVLTAIDE